MVVTANGEASHVVHIDRPQASRDVVERQSCFVVGDLNFPIRRTLRFDVLHAVIFRQRPADKAGGDVVLVFRMDVVGFSEVNNDGFASVRQ